MAENKKPIELGYIDAKKPIELGYTDSDSDTDTTVEESNPSTYGIKQEQPVQEKKEKGVVKKDATATPKKNTASKPATTSSASQNPFSSSEVYTPEWANVMKEQKPVKPVKQPAKKQNVPIDFSKAAQLDFSELGGPSADNGVGFKELGETPEYKAEKAIKAAKAAELKDKEEAEWKLANEKARIHHYNLAKQWKEDDAIIKHLETPDQADVEKAIADEENTNQFGDWVSGFGHGLSNIGGGIYNTANNMLGKPFISYEYYKMGDQVKPYDSKEEELQKQLEQEKKQAALENRVWEMPSEEELMARKKALFIKDAEKASVDRKINDALSTGLIGSFTDEGSKKEALKERLNLHKIQSIENISNEQKINTFKSHLKGSLVDALGQDILKDKHLIDTNQANENIVNNYNAKVEKYYKAKADYDASLDYASQLKNDKASAEENLEMYKLNYNTYSKIHSDFVSPTEEFLGGAAKIMKYVDPFAAVISAVDGKENYWDTSGDFLMKAAEENMGSHYQYSLDNVHSISDFGGYFSQNVGGILPYVLAPEGEVAKAAFMASAAGKNLYSMESEEKANPNVKYNIAQKAFRAGAAAFGEGLMVGGLNKAMKGTAPVLEGIFAKAAEKEAFEKGAKDYVSSVINKFPKNYISGINHAGLTGATVSGINAIADNVILGKKTDVSEAMIDGYSNMAIVGAGLAAFPSVWGYGVTKLSETIDNKNTRANTIEIAKQKELLNDPNLHPDAKKVITDRISKLEQDNERIFQKSVDRLGYFTKPQIKDLFDIDQEKVGIREQYKKIKESKDADLEGNKAALKDLERQWNEAENKKAKIFEKHNSLDYIKSESEKELLEVKAKKSLEIENANPNTPNVKITEESIKDRMAQMHLIETKMVDNIGEQQFNELYDKAFKNVENKVTDKQKQEGYSISDFDVLKETQKLYEDKVNFKNKLSNQYSPEGKETIWKLNEKKSELEKQIKLSKKEGAPTAALENSLKQVISDLTRNAGTVAMHEKAIRNAPKNLTNLEKQIWALNKISETDTRQFETPFGENKPFQVFETTKDVREAMDNYEKVHGKKSDADPNANAFILDNGQIIVNKEASARSGNTNGPGHELLHRVMDLHFKGDSYGKEINDLYSELDNVTAKRKELENKKAKGQVSSLDYRMQNISLNSEENKLHASIEDRLAKQKVENANSAALVESFKTFLSKKELDIIQKRIDNNYRYKFVDKDLYNNLKSKNHPVLNKYINAEEWHNNKVRLEVDPIEYQSEWFTVFSDAINSGEIKWYHNMDAAFSRIGKTISEWFRKNTDISMNFKDGEDVYNFIRDYNKNLAKAKLSERASNMIKENEKLFGDRGKTSTSKSFDDERDALYDKLMENGDYDAYERELAKIDQREANSIVEARPVAEKVAGEESVRMKKNVSVDEQKLGKDIDNLVGPKDANGNYTMTKDQWDKGGILRAKEKLIDGNTLEPIIRKELTKHGVTSDNVHGVPIDQFFEDVKNRVLESALLKFDPERNNSLGGYIIGSQFGIKNRIGDIVNKYKKLLNTKSIDIEAGETGSMLELSDEDQMNFVFEDPNLEEEAPKYKLLSDSKIVGPEVIESAKEKALRTVRTLKTKLSKPELNVMVSPFVKEIRDEMGKQVDIDLKTAMGGKKDNQLRDWAINAKKAFLENMTTTFLMGKDGVGGVPQAIQKRINGEWVSYPDWVGKTPDRESVNEQNAGRTAGHHMVRRLPDAANKISDEVFLSQLLDETGNPIRGRKESWAQAIAQELTLELIGKDLKEHGPIYEALSKNQELLGNALGDTAVADVLYQFERGNTKLSLDAWDKSVLLNNAKNDLFEALGELNEPDYAKVYYHIHNSAKNPLSQELKDKIAPLIDNIKRIAADTKVFSSISKISGANTSIQNLRDIESSYKLHADKTRVAQDIKDYVNFELPAVLSSKGTLQTRVGDWFERQLKGAFQNSPELFKGPNDTDTTGKFWIENSERYNQIYGKKIPTTSLMYGNEKVRDFTQVIDKKQGLLNESTREATIEKHNQDAIGAKDYLYKVIDKAIEENWGKAKMNDWLNTMKSTQDGGLKRLFDIGMNVIDTPVNDTVWEHDSTMNNLTKKILDVVEDPTKLDDLKAFIDNSRVNLISKEMNEALKKDGYNRSGIERYAGENTSKEILKAISKGNIQGLENIPYYRSIVENAIAMEAVSPSKTKRSVDLQDAILDASERDKEPKGISVLDFDDTVGLTNSNVLYTMPNGETGKLNGAEFAKEGSRLLDEGAKFDFSEFSKVVDGRPGPLAEKMKKLVDKFGPDSVHILTARPADSAEPIHQFLSSIGINIPVENITGLANSSPKAKADWVVGKVAEGYNDFYFVDDHLPNVEAVKNALDLFDVKSKVRQAKARFSASMSEEFNKIIEENTGMEHYKSFSDIVAKRRGHEANTFQFYVPPSAADFELLLYNFMGKGKRGEEHAKFFNEALLRPYAEGNDMMDAARQSIKSDYKKLNRAFPNVKNKLESLTPDKDFTYDQAVRVAMWKQEGVEIPGLSERDANKLTALVNSDPELNAFKEGLIITGRQGKGWVTPEKNWDANTIISDLHNLTEGEGRKKFLKEFIDNSTQLFGKWEEGKLVGPNMNKIEAVYGTNVREALEDSIYRMTNGKNRSYGKDKETTAWSNWVNGSTGSIMFLNTRSAALQLLGAVNFLNLRDNNPIAAAKAFANQPQYWKDFAHIWNSAKIKERRGGLKDDVAAAEIANAAATAKTSSKPKAVLSYLLKIGYTPTQIADSFAIASGGAPFYRNRINSYLKEGLSQAEAEHMAWNDFTKVSDETQQSGDPRDISKQQASGAGRLLLTFQNTAMQQSRIIKKSYLDLKNGRGDAKTHVAKIGYYLAVQNAMFSALQAGLFAVFFDDDKDQDKKDKETEAKLYDVADGVLDTILRGAGFMGGTVATLKNMYLKYREEEPKKFKADYAKVVLEGANISPPIGSKLKKIYSGLQQSKFKKDLIKERGWGIMQDGRVHLGPMYDITGSVVEGATNVPMNRLVNKIENVSQAMNSQNKAWQRVAIGMGWSPYSVGIKGSEADLAIEEKAAAERKEAGKIKAKETREAKKDSIANLSPEAYLEYMDKKHAKKQAKKDSIANLDPEDYLDYLEKQREKRKHHSKAYKASHTFN